MNVNAQGLQQGSDHWSQGRSWWPSMGEKTVWTDETEMYQNDGKKKVWRRRKTDHVWTQTTLSVTHGRGNVACTGMAASGTSSLVFIYDGTSDRKWQDQL